MIVPCCTNTAITLRIKTNVFLGQCTITDHTKFLLDGILLFAYTVSVEKCASAAGDYSRFFCFRPSLAGFRPPLQGFLNQSLSTDSDRQRRKAAPTGRIRSEKPRSLE